MTARGLRTTCDAVAWLLARVERLWCRLIGAPRLGHIPGPRGIAFVRLMLCFLADSLAALEITRARYGPIVSYPWPISTVIVYEPDAVERVLFDRERRYEKGAQTEEMRVVMGDGLVTNNDRASWAERRAIVSRAMGPRSIRSFGQTFAALADEMVSRWCASSTVDASRDLAELTFAIAGRTLLGAELSREDAHRADEAVRFTARVIHQHMFSIAPIPYWVPTPSHVRFHRHRRALDAIVGRLVRAARASTSDLGRIRERSRATRPAGWAR